MAKVQYFGTGRRKNSTARVILEPGSGTITINGKDIKEAATQDKQVQFVTELLVHFSKWTQTSADHLKQLDSSHVTHV